MLQILPIATALTLLVCQANASEAAFKASADLAARLKLEPSKVSVVSEKPTTWLDGSLGLREQDHVYTKAIEQGSAIILQAQNTKYLYTASRTAVKFGGPLELWKKSLLYLANHENEPNLNGDLMACSLLGTNPRLILENVSSYQTAGDQGILALRRTSRSGFQMLYLKNGESKPVKIDAAFSYGAFAGEDKMWIAHKRPRLGADWEIHYGLIGENGSKVAPMLPEGRPDRFLVENGRILANAGLDWFELDRSESNPRWKPTAAPLETCVSPVLMNRSVSLVVEMKGQDTVVAKQMFQSPRLEIARILKLQLKSFEYILGRYVVVCGIRDDKLAVFVVDLSTEAVFDSLAGDYREPRVSNLPAVPSVELKGVF